ncbi:MAG: hypothetical protein H8D46_01520 [FCB group bacterium]|nr:hypothetical protein [FCB group bacterium]
MLSRSLIITLIIYVFTGLSAQEFSEGPYGTWYNDIAGPFFLPDINSEILGDVNGDDVTNVQDIILVVNAILDNIELTGEQFENADVNTDGILDILDIVTFVNLILYPQPPGWDFEVNWNGQESYIFIHKSNSVLTSEALWYSNTKEAFLNNSPLNVHYFFISDNFTYEAEVANLRAGFQEVLVNFTPELQNHWESHLHFIPVQSTDLENWLGETLQGKYAFGIDRFQRIRQVGYLGNPNGFTGTYLSYIAHEAIYYDHQYEKFSTIDPEMMEIALFDSVVYNGGWSPTLTANIILPDDEMLSTFNRMEVEADMP